MSQMTQEDIMEAVATTLDPGVLRAVVSLKEDSRFSKFCEYLAVKLEEARVELEHADQRFRQGQGRVEAFREMLGFIDGANDFLRFHKEGQSAE